MKKKLENAKKVPVGFRINAELESKLKVTSERTKMKKVQIVEAALEHYFAGVMASELVSAAKDISAHTLAAEKIKRAAKAQPTARKSA